MPPPNRPSGSSAAPGKRPPGPPMLKRRDWMLAADPELGTGAKLEYRYMIPGQPRPTDPRPKRESEDAARVAEIGQVSRMAKWEVSHDCTCAVLVGSGAELAPWGVR